MFALHAAMKAGGKISDDVAMADGVGDLASFATVSRVRWAGSLRSAPGKIEGDKEAGEGRKDGRSSQTIAGCREASFQGEWRFPVFAIRNLSRATVF